MPPKKSVTGTSLDMKGFQELFKKSKHVLVITGAGISAESGVPTFRGANSSWKDIEPITLSSLKTFKTNPTLMWEYYNYLRELVMNKKPNPAHSALAKAEKRFEKEGKKFCVVTMNIDQLHRQAGTTNLVEIHGSLFETLCTTCKNIEKNWESPICSYFKDNNSFTTPEPVPEVTDLKQLPTCKQPNCNSLLRPNIVWYGEQLKDSDHYKVQSEIKSCDLCLIIGTSNLVKPACFYGERVVERGVPVAEFNIEKNALSDKFQYFLAGACGKTLPEALSVT